MPYRHANGRCSAIVPVKTQQSQGFAPYRGTRGPKAGCRAPRSKTVCRQGLAQKPTRLGAGFLYLALVIGSTFTTVLLILPEIQPDTNLPDWTLGHTRPGAGTPSSWRSPVVGAGDENAAVLQLRVNRIAHRNGRAGVAGLRLG